MLQESAGMMTVDFEQLQWVLESDQDGTLQQRYPRNPTTNIHTHIVYVKVYNKCEKLYLYIYVLN